jgi:hypothetical protein
LRRTTALLRYCPGIVLILICAAISAGAQEEETPTTDKQKETGRATPAKQEPVKAGAETATPESKEAAPAKLVQPQADFASRYTQEIQLPSAPAAGLKIGRTTLFPSYTETLTYEDNLFGTPNKKTSELTLYSQAGMGVQHQFAENIVATANYKFGWNEYLDEEAKDYLTHNADFNMSFRNVVPGFSLNLFDSYGQTGNTGVLNTSFRAFTRQHENTSGLIASYERERVEAQAVYSWTLVDEFGRNGNDYFYHTVDGLVGYKVTAQLKPYFRYRFMTYDFEVDANNYTVHEVVGGVKYRPFQPFEFDFQVGNRRAIAVAGLDSNDGEIARIRLTYYRHEWLTAYAEGSREFEVGVLTGGSNTSHVEVGMNCRIVEGLSLGSRLAWTREARLSGEDLRTSQAGMLVRYDYLRQFSFTGEYMYTARESNLEHFVGYNRATLGFLWRF